MPDEFPRPVLPCEFASDLVGAVVVGNAEFKVIRLADIEFA